MNKKYKYLILGCLLAFFCLFTKQAALAQQPTQPCTPPGNGMCFAGSPGNMFGSYYIYQGTSYTACYSNTTVQMFDSYLNTWYTSDSVGCRSYYAYTIPTPYNNGYVDYGVVYYSIKNWTGNVISGFWVGWAKAPQQSCTCGSYNSYCSGANRYYYRTCSPSGCAQESYWSYNDPSCAVSASINLYSSPTNTINYGYCTNLYWSASNASYVNLSWLGNGYGLSGSSTVCPTVNTQYWAQAIGGGNPIDYETIYVNPPPPPTLNFWADSYSIPQGSSTILRWSATNSYGVWSHWLNGWVGFPSSTYVSPSSTTTYYLTAYGNGGSVQRSVTINVIPPPTITMYCGNARIGYYNQNCTIYNNGEGVLLQWYPANIYSNNGVYLYWLGSYFNPSGSGSRWEYPSIGNHTYQAGAFGAGGSAIATNYVNVVYPPPTLSFSATPSVIYGNGGNVTLNWSATNASSISSNFGAYLNSGTINNYFVSQSTLFNVNVWGPGGSVSRSQWVYVYPGHFSMNAGTAGCNGLNSANTISWSPSDGAVSYRVYRTSGQLVGTTSGTTIQDTNVSYPTTYSYYVDAVNAQGYTTRNNAPNVSVTTRYCIPPKVDIWAEPANILVNTPTTIKWSANDVTNVSIDQGIGTVHTSAMPQNPSGEKLTGNLIDNITYTITGQGPGGAPVTDSVTVLIGNTHVKGDVYSGGNGSQKLGLQNIDNKIYFDPKSVISANGSINAPSAPWQISNYSYSKILWDLARNRMNKFIDTHRTQPCQLASSSISVSFNLSDNNCVGNETNNNSADGKIWYHNGNLTLNNVKFSGKGTIIVENGNLYINDDIDYSVAPPGFVVKGDLIIANTVNIVWGAYYVYGNIEM